MQDTRCPPCRAACSALVAPGQAPSPSAWRMLLAALGFLAVMGLAVLSIMAMTALASVAHALAGEAGPAPARQAELVRLVRQECGFCHGLRLTGGLGSPLTAPAMAEKPAETLEAVILHGIPGTAMPPWRPFISDADVSWIVRRLQEGFPHDSR